MIKRILLLLVIIMSFGTLVFAQNREISGTVRDDNGNPISGASVIIKGTVLGVPANNAGEFKINAKTGDVLEVSAANFTPLDVKVGTQQEISVTLQRGNNVMEEVVVTALGIKRDKRELATATQTINSNEINKSGGGNALSELQGKASGLTVINSAGDPGAGTYIRLRGVTSITGNNQPLMVIDGVPIDNSVNSYDPTSAAPKVSGPSANQTGGATPTNRGVDINPSDIESITLLKGPAATALYGISAASGAIIITTKRGGAGGTNISFNSSVTFDKVSQLPGYQNLYSQGSDGLYAGPKGNSSRRLSWGAAIDTLSWDGNSNIWDPHGNIVGNSSPLAKIPVKPYNPYDFFQTGQTFNNNIAISGGNNKTGFRLSLGNLHQTGIIPTSEYVKTTLSLNGQSAISDKFSISGGIDYINSTNNKVQQGSNVSSIMLGLLRTPPTFDNSYGLSDAASNPASYLQPNGQQRDYRGGAGYDNPYWTINRIPFVEKLDRAIGYGQASYKLFDWISFNYRLGGDVYSQNDKNAYDIYSNAFPAGAVHLLSYNNEQFNSDFTINLKKTLSKDFMGSLLLGQNYFTSSNSAHLSHGSGLVLPNFLDMSNATSYTVDELNTKKRTSAFYGEAHLDFRDMLYLTVSGRRETSSTLPPDNNTFFYPSASLAWEFTKNLNLSANSALNYGKLRVSAAQVGKDAPVQGLLTYFGPAVINDGFTTGIQFPISGNSGYQISSTTSTIGNPKLKAEKTNSYEIGTDLGFLNNRIVVNATAYQSKSTDVILVVPIAYSTGFSSQYLNAATITNKGLEITLSTTPVKSKDFTWDLNFNFSTNKNEVVSLATGVPKVLISGFQNGEIDAVAGKAFGQIYGSVLVRSDPGDMNSPLLINDSKGDPGYGMPILSTTNAAIGDINPKWNGSAINTITYKGISLSAQLDIRQGGKIWDGTRGAMSYFGTSAESANRNQPVTFKGVAGHIDADGNVVHYGPDGTTEISKPGPANTAATTYSQYYWQNIGSSFVGPAELSVEDGSYVRFRQISLGYELPKDLIQRAHFTNVSITVFANNPFLWTKYKGVDPETSLAGPANGQGLDYFNNPGTKSYGIRLNIGLK
ncbi:MAG: SusC/RagA family TonB-linked outer membrane protein [Mucilaginibacter sp.]